MTFSWLLDGFGWLRHKKYLVRFRKRPWFGLKLNLRSVTYITYVMRCQFNVNSLTLYNLETNSSLLAVTNETETQVSTGKVLWMTHPTPPSQLLILTCGTLYATALYKSTLRSDTSVVPTAFTLRNMRSLTRLLNLTWCEWEKAGYNEKLPVTCDKENQESI